MAFSETIRAVLQSQFKKDADAVYEKSDLLQYIDRKTQSANRGSKSRGSFANLYALYVVIEDYLDKGYDKKTGYSKQYAGAQFTVIFARQRELPFGDKLQNHGLNSRCNGEFQKFFPQCDYIPIVRNVKTQRYWINENLLKVSVGSRTYNIGRAIIEIVDEYGAAKRDALVLFLRSCEELKHIKDKSGKVVSAFIEGLLAQNVDARLFEIVSYAILKYFYDDKKIYWGFDTAHLQTETLKLYKTGRTNANDGGIDFVMRPLGRFFQVTETLDVKKYFLDIDKIERFPITFVIKSEESVEALRSKLNENAQKLYAVPAVIRNYMNCIEEIINIPFLKKHLDRTIAKSYLNDILDEIIKQSRLEFNYNEVETKLTKGKKK